jgi:hypothetical protein
MEGGAESKETITRKDKQSVTQRTGEPGSEAQISLHQERRSRADAKTAIGFDG